MTSAPLRTAVIGYGLGGRVFHTPFLAASPDYTLDGVVTGSPQRADEVRERYGDIVIPDADALLARAADFDVVVVTTPNATHAPLAHRALDAGLHVVVDKPVALTAADATALAVHAAEVGRTLSVFQNRRWDGDFLTVRTVLESGLVGEVRVFESAFEVWKPTLGAKKWKEGAAAAEGGGVLFDLGPHVIDQALQLFGPVDRVHAELDARRDGAVADDDAFVTLRHEGGVRSRLWTSVVAPSPRPRFRVIGSAGVFETRGLDPQEAQLAGGATPADPGYGLAATAGVLLRPDAPDEEVPLERGDYPAFYASFAAAVLSGAPVPVEVSDAVAVLRIIEEAHRQAR
ncbi:Gfo/Idh/MocA family oxidoreductase [Herbiconiux sp. CPCC 205716]|uniref:Gfo/Idh/MocA family oxidoreductase n=1 Tax=Herbiconiux gentiana TaxID=2970912 RepID=A0ABT2GBP8_9MICO|nr:Gfo/Idh/MocA family oxidoreductase [Herbiconiux gentiana]MCS5713607.1 Gfo/Idh/MocA family oxidoreductase [Herbiconiux gentiana]